MHLKVTSFEADTPVNARLAACRWLSDFAEHGPLDILAIRVTGQGDAFTATVTYTDMALEGPAAALREEKAALRMIA